MFVTWGIHYWDVRYTEVQLYLILFNTTVHNWKHSLSYHKLHVQVFFTTHVPKQCLWGWKQAVWTQQLLLDASILACSSRLLLVHSTQMFLNARQRWSEFSDQELIFLLLKVVVLFQKYIFCRFFINRYHKILSIPYFISVIV